MRVAKRGALCLIALTLLGSSVSADMSERSVHPGARFFHEEDRTGEESLSAVLSEDESGSRNEEQPQAATENQGGTENPVETEKPAETTNPVETEKPAETTDPVETEKPAETTNPVETEKPTETAESTATPTHTTPAVTPTPTAKATPTPTAKATNKPAGKAATATPTTAPTPTTNTIALPVITETPTEAPTETPAPTGTLTPQPTGKNSESEFHLDTAFIVLAGTAVALVGAAIVLLPHRGKIRHATGRSAKDRADKGASSLSGRQHELVGIPGQDAAVNRQSVHEVFSVSLRLTPVSGSTKGEIVIPLRGDRANVVTIGRDEGKADHILRVNDRKVSGRHAALTLRNGQVLLADAGSTNGTYVNGKRITQPVVLNQKDEISFGPETGYTVTWTAMEQ